MLVERFVRAVLEDGVDVGAILTITFTEKAAAELRDRIRARLRALGANDAARATEGAYISTIHGFCARVLRAHALAAGSIRVRRARRARGASGSRTVRSRRRSKSWRGQPGAVELIASYLPGGPAGGILDVYGELRSRGQTEPELPALPPAPDLEVAGGAGGPLRRR